MISFCLLLIILYLILDTHKYSENAPKCSLSRTSKINDPAAAMLLCFGKKRHYTLHVGRHLFFRPLELRILATTPPTTTPTPRAREGRARSQFFAPVPCPPRHVPKNAPRPHNRAAASLIACVTASPTHPTHGAQNLAIYRPIIKLAQCANL